MRPIKFRVWYIDEMVFSDCAVGECEFVFDNNGEMRFDVWQTELHELTVDGDVTYSGYDTYTKDTMQYIGRRDMNDKEIYEGDIIKDEYNRIMVVEWHNCGFCFKAVTPTNFVRAHNIMEWFDDMVARPEIIGNVHENPEMLDPESVMA